MLVLARAATVCLALAVVGCLTLNPAGEHSLQEVRAFADETARIYGLPRIHVDWTFHDERTSAAYRQGMITLDPRVLVYQYRDAIVAHELAHYVLGHHNILARSPGQREFHQAELDANAKAVEILVRAGGRSEEEALRLMHEDLVGARGTWHWGHASACEEITDLLRRFPAHRYWTATLECAPAEWAAR